MRGTDMATIRIESITDAKNFVFNSGVSDWEWSENASANGFARWVFDNCRTIDSENYDDELRNYILSAGDAPADYSL